MRTAKLFILFARFVFSLAVLCALGWSVVAFAQVTPIATPPAPAESVPISWLTLVVGVLVAVLVWYRKNVEPRVDAKLTTIANDATKTKLERTAAQVALDLEPLVISAAGHVGDDVAADGSDLHKLSTDAATDLVDGLSAGAKVEAEKYFGTIGGGLVDFLSGLIKSKVLGAQATKVQDAVAAGAAAAAKVTTGQNAVDEINGKGV